MTERTYEFNWDIIGDLQEGRPNLGDKVDFILCCLMHYTFRAIAVKHFGLGGSYQLFHDAGNISGRFFFEQFLKEYKDLPLDMFLEKFHFTLRAQGVHFFRVDSVDTDKMEFSFSVASDIDGANLPFVHIDENDYEAGIIEGVLFKYTGKQFKIGTVNTDNVQDIIPKKGDTISLIPYRMLQYTVRDVTEQRIGTETCDQFFYDAGEIAGDLFFEYFLKEFKNCSLNEFIAELQNVLKKLGVGILRIEKADVDKGEFILTVSEDLDCSGLPDLGLEVCNYDEGFIAGIFYRYTGIPFKAKEVDCWCSGDRTCRFAVNKV